jgi:ribosomal-protein-alanine N-acetyltransferase
MCGALMWKRLPDLRMTPNPDAGSEIPAAIRAYVPGDAPAITALGELAPEAAQWSAENYQLAAAAGQTILVAEAGHEIGGFLVCRFVGAEGEILNAAVARAHRRKGVGSKLLATALEEAKSQGVERVYLEVRESNVAAISFYARHGFANSGRRAKYYRDPTENAVVMEKKLTG